MVEVLANELRADDNSVQETDVKRRKSKSKKQTSASEKLGKPSKMEGLAATAPESPDVLNKSPSQKSQKAVENQGPAEPPKKSKKRKHMVVDPESGTQTPGSSQPKDVSSVEEPPKKKHKNRTEFADPRIDTTLNNQSRKALEYAFLQMNRPSKWKFNKARQNWLIRNIWNSEAISNVYFPFILKYLANIQGGSREKLKETCEVYLKPAETPKPRETTAQMTDTLTSVPKSILKQSETTTPKAGPLIDAAPVLGPLVSSPSTALPETLPLSPTLTDIQKQRAQSLLDALGSGSSA